MAELETNVAAHYGGQDVLSRVLGELKAAGLDPEALRPEDLKPFESLHVGGWQATEDLLARLRLERGARVLDVGCGIGGASRALAVQHAAVVTGIDLTPEFVTAAQELSRRAGVADVSFRQASATELPFGDGTFSAAVMLHVGMNVPDKPRLFAEVARVLRPGGRFAVYDLMRFGPDALVYPMPWAQDAATSFLETPDAYAAAAAAAGFEEVARTDRREGAVAYLEAQIARAAGTPMEPRFRNLLAAVREGTVAPVAMILR
jgi:ubiquinone/menaquinone biosynthesis C-methylase UbiE